MRLISWNIDSLNAALTSDSQRAQLSRDVMAMIREHDADVIALQEIKVPYTGLNKAHHSGLATYFPDYEICWVGSQAPARKSYAGTMFLYRSGMEPIITTPQIEAPDTMDLEGRMLTLELPECYITQVYTPNAGDGLRRLSDRMLWDQQYLAYLSHLDQQKPIIAMGDFNVAHREIDLAHPDRNQMSPGFTREERDGFAAILANGFIDTFRLKYPEATGAYTWWPQRVRTSKVNNSGWRIDYFIVSERLCDQVVASEILDSGPRQDHTPILLEISL